MVRTRATHALSLRACSSPRATKRLKPGTLEVLRKALATHDPAPVPDEPVRVAQQPETLVGSAAQYLVGGGESSAPLSEVGVDDLRVRFMLQTVAGAHAGQIALELLERVAMATDELVTATGGIIVPAHTRPAHMKNAAWVVLYGAVMCAGYGCSSSLPCDDSYTSRAGFLQWWAPECGHALRFCGVCGPRSGCWMCCDERPMSLRSCIQSRGGDHARCVLDPCTVCAYTSG